MDAAGADAPRMERLTYSGRRGPLYRIFLTNLGLSIVTLTIYRFWGRVRLRRYLWGRMEFQGDRFEWTGTGGEMFRAFLVAAAVLLALALPLTLLQLLAPQAFAEISMVQTLYLIALLSSASLHLFGRCGIGSAAPAGAASAACSPAPAGPMRSAPSAGCCFRL